MSKVILCAVDFCVHPLRDCNCVFVNSGGGVSDGGDGGGRLWVGVGSLITDLIPI